MERPHGSLVTSFALSVTMHVAIGLVGLPLHGSGRDRERDVLVYFDLDVRGTAFGGREGLARAPQLELTPGGRKAAQNIDAHRPGERGEEAGARTSVLLLERADGILLQSTPMNALEVSQAQRIRTDHDRGSEDDQRATPNPGDEAFLASGHGVHPERRPVSAVDARRGAGSAPPASPDASEQATPAPALSASGTLAVSERPAAPSVSQASPGRGIAAGRGPRSSDAAAVAHARPPLDRERASTTTKNTLARVRDDVDSELLAARMIESMIESTARRGPREGEGAGGVGGGGAPGVGGSAGEGGRSSAHSPGSGRFNSLDTSDARYMRWYLEQRRRVERALVYPRQRRLALDQGTSVYALVVRRNGELVSSPRLVRSSGFADLDDAARAAIEASTPFSPVPEELLPSAPAIPVTLSVQFVNPMFH